MATPSTTRATVWAGSRGFGKDGNRPAELPRDAAIKREKETGAWVDRYGRNAEKCRADAGLAGSLAEALAHVWRSLEAGELEPQHERVFGPKLQNRLEADWAKLDQLRARDLEWADAIDAMTEWDLARARVEESAS